MSAPIREALKVLSEPGQVIELRIPRVRHTPSGYFDDLDRAAEAAAKLNGTSSVYMTLNPCNPALLARGVNRIVEYPEATTSDRDILQRAWFPIDLDPMRPTGVSSTEGEHESALARAREVLGHLRSEGWPEPLIADSGNGAHLLYRIALPNNAESTELLKRCLQALALRFSDDLVSVDEKVFNAARIWKVYGTTACKGDNTPDRPHRQAKLLRVPDDLEVVSLDKLAALADTAPKPSQRNESGGARFDLDHWISDRALDVAGPVEWSGGRKWIFRVCPWNEEHRNRSAYIVQLSSGGIAAGCQHDGCKGKDWAALRAMYEPKYRDGSSWAGTQQKTSPDTEAWREPQPLTVKLTSEPYPLDALPDIIRGAIEEVQAFTKAPIALVASSAMGAMSGALQAYIDVRRAPHLEGPTSLYLLSLAGSGERKTTCDKDFSLPIRDYEARQAELADPEVKKYDAAIAAWTAERDGILMAIRTAVKLD